MVGHFGKKWTLRKILDKYKRKGMHKDVEEHVRKCEKFQKNIHSRATRMPMTLTQVAEKPFEKIYVDVVCPLPLTVDVNKYILTMMDDLKRFVDFAPMANQEAATVARILFEQILSLECRLQRIIHSSQPP